MCIFTPLSDLYLAWKRIYDISENLPTFRLDPIILTLQHRWYFGVLCCADVTPSDSVSSVCGKNWMREDLEERWRTGRAQPPLQRVDYRFT